MKVAEPRHTQISLIQEWGYKIRSSGRNRAWDSTPTSVSNTKWLTVCMFQFLLLKEKTLLWVFLLIKWESWIRFPCQGSLVRNLCDNNILLSYKFWYLYQFWYFGIVTLSGQFLPCPFYRWAHWVSGGIRLCILLCASSRGKSRTVIPGPSPRCSPNSRGNHQKTVLRTILWALHQINPLQ